MAAVAATVVVAAVTMVAAVTAVAAVSKAGMDTKVAVSKVVGMVAAVATPVVAMLAVPMVAMAVGEAGTAATKNPRSTTLPARRYCARIHTCMQSVRQKRHVFLSQRFLPVH